jgi:tight adherence protein C
MSIHGYRNMDSVNINDLRKRGLWWVIMPGTGHIAYKWFNKILKHSTRERIIIARFSEIFPSEGLAAYKASRSAQIGSLFFIILLIEIFVLYLKSDSMSFVFYGSLIAGIIFLPDKTVYKMCIKRRRRIENSMPEFLSRLAVLVDAGLTVRTAIKRVVSSSRAEEDELHKELKTLINDHEIGKGENASFEGFAKRCNTSTAAAFASVVLQNIKKGNRELSAILRLFAGSSWTLRRNAAKKSGEEAAAKLMSPMMIIFLAIMILMAAPALMKIGL